MQSAETVSKNFQSTSIIPRLPTKPINELIAIILNEVPIDFFIGTLMKKISTGIIINPPPAPTNPVINPTNIAIKMTK